MPAPRKPKRVNAAYLKKEPTETHQAFAEYIFNTTGQEVSNEIVALVQRLYPLFLKSPAVVEAREKAKAEREAEEARKQAEKQRRVRERLAKIEAQRAKLLADLGLDEGQDPEEPVNLSVVPEPDPEVEADLAEVEDNDGEPESDEVTLEDDSEEDEDLWDDEDEAEDF